MLSAARMLQKKGYKLFATGGSSKFLTENGVENTRVYWPSEPDMHPQALEMLHRKEIDMVQMALINALARRAFVISGILRSIAARRIL